MVEQDEKVVVAMAMIKYGGSFASALGKALLQADPFNTEKIYGTWTNMWDKYKEAGLRESKSLN